MVELLHAKMAQRTVAIAEAILMRWAPPHDPNQGQHR